MSELANLESLLNMGITGAELNEQFRGELTAHRQFPGAWPAVVVQIENGILTPAHAYTIVDAEGSAPADDLELIAVTNTHDGMELKLVAQDSRDIIVRHNPNAVYGISLAGREDITLPADRFLLLKRFSDRWQEIVDGSASPPMATTERAGIVRFATDARLTQENTEEVTSAAQFASLYFRTAAAEGSIAAANSRIETMQQVMHVQDQKPSGTAGGTFTAGAWRTRDLNTVVENTISGASLANNQITLPVGKYEIFARAPSYITSGNRTVLRNITNSTIVLFGSNSYNHSSTNVASDSVIQGSFILDQTSVFEIQHRSLATLASTGLGVAAIMDGLVEIYTNVYIRRIA